MLFRSVMKNGLVCPYTWKLPEVNDELRFKKAFANLGLLEGGATRRDLPKYATSLRPEQKSLFEAQKGANSRLSLFLLTPPYVAAECLVPNQDTDHGSFQAPETRWFLTGVHYPRGPHSDQLEWGIGGRSRGEASTEIHLSRALLRCA